MSTFNTQLSAHKGTIVNSIVGFIVIVLLFAFAYSLGAYNASAKQVVHASNESSSFEDQIAALNAKMDAINSKVDAIADSKPVANVAYDQSALEAMLKNILCNPKAYCGTGSDLTEIVPPTTATNTPEIPPVQHTPVPSSTPDVPPVTKTPPATKTPDVPPVTKTPVPPTSTPDVPPTATPCTPCTPPPPPTETPCPCTPEPTQPPATQTPAPEKTKTHGDNGLGNGPDTPPPGHDKNGDGTADDSKGNNDNDKGNLDCGNPGNPCNKGNDKGKDKTSSLPFGLALVALPATYAAKKGIVVIEPEQETRNSMIYKVIAAIKAWDMSTACYYLCLLAYKDMSKHDAIVIGELVCNALAAECMYTDNVDLGNQAGMLYGWTRHSFRSGDPKSFGRF